MSQVIRTTATRHRRAHEPVAGPDDRVSIAPSYVLDRIFRFFISMKLGLALLLVLALLTLAGTLIAQVPSGMKSDPQAYAAWLDGVRPKYRGWTGTLDRLQLFSVFTSIWFRAAMALLITSLLACSIHRAPRLWQKAARPRMRMPDAFFERAPLGAQISSSSTPDSALAGLTQAFRSHHFRVTAEEHEGVTYVCADRFRWGPFGRVVAHLSFVVILVGGLIGSTWGFRDNELAVPVGSRVTVGHGTGLSVEATSFSDSYYMNGAPSDFASDLVVYKGDKAVRTQTVRVNHPLRYDGISFYQSFFGPAAAMRVSTPTGARVFDGGVPLPWGSDDGKHRIGRFVLPEQGLTVFLVGPASGEVDRTIQAGQIQLEVYKTGQDAPVATQVASQGKPARIAGLDFTFVRERQFTGLIVARDPGSWLVWLGATLLVAGMFVVFFFPHRRVRASIKPAPGGSETAVAATWRNDARFEADFDDIVDDVQLAIDRASTT